LSTGPARHGDTELSLAEAVFGAIIILPNEFLKGDEIPVNTVSKF
jgi:hypothetical protein